jgi:hypothetical protein
MRIEKIFVSNRIISLEKMTQLGLKLEDAIVDCFSTLPTKCRDEELEDLVYFFLDLYQLHGVPVALSEVDIDQVCSSFWTLSQTTYYTFYRLSLICGLLSKNTMPGNEGESFLLRIITCSLCWTKIYKGYLGSPYLSFVAAQ